MKINLVVITTGISPRAAPGAAGAECFHSQRSSRPKRWRFSGGGRRGEVSSLVSGWNEDHSRIVSVSRSPSRATSKAGTRGQR